MPNIENNITAVQRRLQQAARDADRNPDDILLLAVSKTRTSAQVNLAHQAGINSFGENYLQEALDKIELLKSQSLDWHFSIKSNIFILKIKIEVQLAKG